MGVIKTSDSIQIEINMPNPSQEPTASSKAQNQNWKDMDFFEPPKLRYIAKIHNMGVSNMSDHI